MTFAARAATTRDEIQAVIDAWNTARHNFWDLWGLLPDDPGTALPPGSPGPASLWWIALAVVLGAAGIGAVWISWFFVIDDDRPLYLRPGVLGLIIEVALLGGGTASITHYTSLRSAYEEALPDPVAPQRAIPEVLARPLLDEHGLTILPAEPVDW